MTESSGVRLENQLQRRLRAFHAADRGVRMATHEISEVVKLVGFSPAHGPPPHPGRLESC